MTAAESRRANPRGNWLLKLLSGLLATIGFLCRSALVGWASLAIYYSNLPWAPLRLVLAVAFAAFGIWALWLTRRSRMFWVFAGLFLGVLGWWLTIQPTPDRDWRPEVAVMPRAVIAGDRVRFTGFRNFEYRAREDFDVRYEEREVDLAHLTSVDLFVSYWRPGPVAHTFVSFNFDNAEPVCISIEVRPEAGKSFSALASLFKQFQLIYVVGDERDIVRVRTNYRPEEVYLYRIRASPAATRKLFLIYLARINQLAAQPEFYHLLRNSCTVNIARYANAVRGAGEWDVRHVLNGYVDRYLYRAGLVDTNLPFVQLRQASRINPKAMLADDDVDFSKRIRAGLPHPK